MSEQVFSYTPDEDLRVHEEAAIRLLCNSFQTHESGLPEWVKNSADAYAREDAPEEKRVIIIFFTNGRLGQRPSIACLDFCGMTSRDIENNFRVWADPGAAVRGGNRAEVQGGHGNGGKSYMTQMFEDYAYLYTVKNGRGNHYGVAGGSVKFGYIPSPTIGRDFVVDSLEDELLKALSIHTSVQSLMPIMREPLRLASGFTLVCGVGPKGYVGRIPVQELITSLQDHPQMIRSLELCKVRVVSNGSLANNDKPLAVPVIEPMPGTNEPRVIEIPRTLLDRVTGDEVDTVLGDQEPGRLELRTSKTSMRYRRKHRHTINFKGVSGYIGHISVLELDVSSPYRDRIYGECILELLETCKLNDRSRLADSPLTRAVYCFVSEAVEAYAREFEARDRRRYSQEERNAVSEMNRALDRWKNRFLAEHLHGLWGDEPGGGTPEPHSPLPNLRPSSMLLGVTHRAAGIGVSFRPTIQFYRDGRKVRAVPYRLCSQDFNVVVPNDELLVLTTVAPGRTTVWAETLDGRVKSSEAQIEVVLLTEINVSPRQIEVPVGSRRALEATCRLSNGEVTSDIYLVWTEGNRNVACVSASGQVFAFSPGETEVVAGDDRCLSEACRIVVKESDRGGPGDREGQSGFPRVLVSSYDSDPVTQEPVNLSRDDPPVYQRPQDVDRNIWWINSSAPLARLYLDSAQGYGYDSREWRMYHLERFVDVIVQIALLNDPACEQPVGVDDWILKWGSKAAEVQGAAFESLASFIADGTLPEE